MLKCPHCGGRFTPYKEPKPYSGYLKDKLPFIVERIKSGDTAREIAIALGGQRHQQTIYMLAAKLGLKLSRPVASPSSGRNNTIYEQRESGMTLRAIGAIHGISPERVRAVWDREERRRRTADVDAAE